MASIAALSATPTAAVDNSQVNPSAKKFDGLRIGHAFGKKKVAPFPRFKEVVSETGVSYIQIEIEKMQAGDLLKLVARKVDGRHSIRSNSTLVVFFKGVYIGVA